MKPHRVRMTYNLLLHYGIYKEMEVSGNLHRPVPRPRKIGGWTRTATKFLQT